MGRKEKYEAKLQAGVIAQGYENTKALAVKKQTSYFASAVELESKVKALMDGVPSFYHHFYIAYAEEFWKKKTDLERLIIYHKRQARGLDAAVLQRVACTLFGWGCGFSWVWDETSVWGTDVWW